MSFNRGPLSIIMHVYIQMFANGMCYLVEYAIKS